MFYVLDDVKADKTNFTPFFVIGGDHHIHSWKYPDPEKRIYASSNVLQQGIDHAKRLAVPLIVNGDLTHDKNSLDPLVTAVLTAQLRAAQIDRVRVILNVGNHERTQKFHQMHTLVCFEPVVELVASEPQVLRFTHRTSSLWMNVMLVPFYYNHKQAMEEIDKRDLWKKVPSNEPLIFVGHYPVDGAEVNGIKPHFGIKYEDFRPTQFEALLFNDIHKAQPISEKAYHLGCTHQNTFGEQGYKYGWWAVGLWGNDPRAITIARLPTHAPEFITGTETEINESLAVVKGDYTREKPATVIARTMAEQGAPRITFKAGDLGDSIEQYLDFQVRQGLLVEPMKQKIKKAVAEVMRPDNAPGAR